MKYTEVRHLIKTGDMLLWRDYKGGSLRSIVERWLIRHYTASPYIHVGIAWVDHGRVWVMDISTSGCAPRLLSNCGSFDWIPSPKPLSDRALYVAFGCFGTWTYSRWQAIKGALKRLTIGKDSVGQCAEFVLHVLSQDGMAPTNTATPAECANGALLSWGTTVHSIQQ